MAHGHRCHRARQAHGENSECRSIEAGTSVPRPIFNVLAPVLELTGSPHDYLDAGASPTHPSTESPRMKILVLSRNANLYSTSALVDAAEARGHEVRVVDYLRCYMNITSHKPAVIYEGEQLDGSTRSSRASAPRTRSTARPWCGSSR